MLRSWSVANFKSIGDKQTLPLGPLTVIAGANNSGKSSLLQSMLITAQTLRSAGTGPGLILDGDLFRRGEAKELIYFGQKQLALRRILGFRARDEEVVSEEETISLARSLLNAPDLRSLAEVTAKQRTSLRSYRFTRVPQKVAPLFSHLKGDYRWRRRPLPAD
jgi:predicted ATPase